MLVDCNISIIKMKKQSMKKWVKNLLSKKIEPDSIEKNYEVQQFDRRSDQWTEAEAEIINHLIQMDHLMRITKQLNYEEYITLAQINEILCQETIDLTISRKALLGGIQLFNEQTDKKYTTQHLPFQYYSVRSLLWKINLHYLHHENKQKWVSSEEKNLIIYRRLIIEFIVVPIEKKLGLLPSPEVRKTSPQEKTVKDHPLNFSQQSKWQNYFKDVEMWLAIERDVQRTRKSCKFFEQPCSFELANQQIPLRPEQITFSKQKQQTYADSLTRIIFIYLKKHPECHYYQGINELVALIYYCFTNKNSEYFRRVSESDTYFVFEMIMSRLPKKHFQKGEEYVERFFFMLKKLDLRLSEEIEKQSAEQTMKLVTMRWFLTGFLNEFSIDDCLILWDVLVTWPAHETQYSDCFIYIGLALVHLNRHRIMDGENIAIIFSKIETPVLELVEKTQSLYKLFPKLMQR